MGLWRKVNKAAQSLSDPLYRRALRFGVSPTHEHRTMLVSLGALRTVVDVGANVGQFALLTLRAQPGAKIHSFEPQPGAAATFKRVVAGHPDVTLHQFALGATRATLPIHITSNADSSSLLAPTLQTVVFPSSQEVGSYDVQVLPLDEVLTDGDIAEPALLKIDVQGYEQQVLEGCSPLLGKFKWLFLELSFVELYAGQVLAPQVMQWLALRGFTLAGVYADPASYRKGRMVQADFLFCRMSNSDVPT